MPCALCRRPMAHLIRSPATPPGDTRFTRTPCSPNSNASVRTMPTSAILLVVYAERLSRGRLPLNDPMTTTLPAPRAIMAGRNARHARNVPVTLTDSVASHSSGSTCHNGADGPPTPLLLTRMSTASNRSCAARASAATCALSPRSVGTTKAVRPCDSTILRVSSSLSTERAASTTCAPSTASVSAITRPMPRPAPVTTATRSCNSPISRPRPSSPSVQPIHAAAVPVDGIGIRSDGHRANVGELVERLPPALAAGAAVAHATPRRCGIQPVMIVDPHDAVLQPAGHPVGAGDVAGPYRRAEPVRRVVGQRDGLVLVVERDDDQNRAEDLLAGDPHVVGDADEHRGLDEPTALASGDLRRSTTGRHCGALPLPDGDVLDDPVACPHRDHRTDLGLGRSRVTDADAACLRHQRVDEVVMDRPLHQHPRPGDAGLPCGDESGEGGALGRGLDRRVVEDD